MKKSPNFLYPDQNPHILCSPINFNFDSFCFLDIENITYFPRVRYPSFKSIALIRNYGHWWIVGIQTMNYSLDFVVSTFMDEELGLVLFEPK